jgi:predicted methyltransferase
MRIAFFVMALAAATSMAAAPPAVDPALQTAIASSQRTPSFVARDAARHPAEELTFFGLKSDANVVELWPGGGYWTEILAPYLATRGHYTAALPPTKDGGEESTTVAQWRARIALQAAHDPRDDARCRSLRRCSASVCGPHPDVSQSAQLDGRGVRSRGSRGLLARIEAGRRSGD